MNGGKRHERRRYTVGRGGGGAGSERERERRLLKIKENRECARAFEGWKRFFQKKIIIIINIFWRKIHVCRIK